MDPRTALRYSVLFALAWCALSGRVAAVDAEIPVGVRSLGMGRTGIASPGRASAMSLNVGSLTSLEAYSAEAFTTDLFGLIRGNYLAAVVPLSDSRALGFDWNRLDYEDTELGFQQNRMRAAYGFRLHERLGLGAGVNYRTQSASLDGGSLGGAAGWSADLGLQWTPPVEGLTVGWSVRNWMSNTSGGRWRSGAWMRVENGEPQRVVPRLRVFGLAYERGDTTARLEWHEGARFGVERQVADWFAVRGGIVKPNVDGEGTTFSLGATGQWRWGAVDYALVISPDLPPTSYFGLAFGLSYRIPPVIVEGVVVNDLYVALRDHYARIPQGRPRARSYESPDAFTRQTNERLGELWLYNPGEESVRVRVRLWIDKYTSGSGTEVVEAVEIEAGQRIIVPMQKLLLSDTAARLTEGRRAEVRLEVIDVERSSRRRALATTSVTLHGRNEMRLDDIGKLAVFITPRDETVQAFATEVIQTTTFTEPMNGLPQNARRAMALFAALKEVGYQSDPNLPRESGTIDAIKFPAELLTTLRQESGGKPVGDCDDSTVLMCALLEAVGIPTALIQSPKHVFMAFDVGGMSLDEAQNRHVDDAVIVLDGNAWVPLETTFLAQGFASAWREGLKQWQSAVNVVTTRNAWEQYDTALTEFTRRQLPVAQGEIAVRIDENAQNEWFRDVVARFTAGAQR